MATWITQFAKLCDSPDYVPAEEPSAILRDLSFEFDRDLARGDWIIRVADPPKMLALMAKRARMAHITVKGDESPDAWFLCFPVDIAPTITKAGIVLNELKCLFDKDSVVIWNDLSIYGNEWVLFGEAPSGFIPQHSRINLASSFGTVRA
ncbi:MAG: hypothetical protein ACK559_24390, partial [bacterium]